MIRYSLEIKDVGVVQHELEKDLWTDYKFWHKMVFPRAINIS